MRFTKMHGCGNDYIYVNCFEEDIEKPNEVSKKLSERHFGIGADGLILIKPSNRADFKMAMYNADGSEGSMCGNGIRCVAKYVYDNRLTKKTKITVDTLSGVKKLQMNIKNDKVDTVKVDMGKPVFLCDNIPVKFQKRYMINEEINVLGRIFTGTAISMGNPHFVTFIKENLDEMNIDKFGREIEREPYFPDRVNVEFVKIIDKNHIKLRVFERGSGETLACGTGACAAVVAAYINGYTSNKVRVSLLGGDLYIEYDNVSGHVFMTGPATVICTGDVDIN
ncbi:MAG: diaminopimelate epimerase [Lachnospiraceae bacterium]|nr:diaminopimelate epimerase [Lachnospiraceae bacterium]